MSTALRNLSMLALLWPCAGCAWFSPQIADLSELPIPRLSDDTVVLEVLTLRVPQDKRDLVNGLWQQVDEQHLPADVRQELVAAGLRSGVIGTQPPEELTELLDEEPTEAAVETESGERLQINDNARRRLQCRAGKSHRLTAAEQKAAMQILRREGDQVRGTTYQQAQAIVLLKTYPQPDGRVKLTLLPEIHYGPPRNQYVGRDGMFVLETGQQRESFSELKLTAFLLPGETLIYGAAVNAAGLGRHFFGAESTPTGDEKLMLIRLAQTQYDDVHTMPKSLTEPVATAE